MDLEIAGEEVVECIETTDNTSNGEYSSAENDVGLCFYKHCFICTTQSIYFPTSTTDSEADKFGKYIKTFCQLLELPTEPFEMGLREAPLCQNCQLRMQLIQQTLAYIGEMQIKLQNLREAIQRDLKLNDYEPDSGNTLDIMETWTSEQKMEFYFLELRNRLKHRLHALQSTDAVDCFFETADKDDSKASRSNDATNTHYLQSLPGTNENESSTVTVNISTFLFENNFDASKNEVKEGVCHDRRSPLSYLCDLDNTEDLDTDDNEQLYSIKAERVEAQSSEINTYDINNSASEDGIIILKIPEGITLRNCSVLLERMDVKNNKMSLMLQEAERRYADSFLGGPARKRRLKNKGQLPTLKINSDKIQCTFVDPLKGRCRRTFVDNEILGAHIKRAHLNVKSDQVYKCKYCDRCKGSKKKIEDHEKIHLGIKDYTCEMCGDSFRNEKLLSEHKRKKHGEAYPFVCDFCNKGFNCWVLLKAHQLSHTGEYSHRCEICNAGFAFSSALRKHMITHSERNIYECGVCKKAMRFKGSLQRHMRTHTGDKPYVCSICQKGFVDSAQLKNHASIHTNERPFLCQQCGASYRVMGHLSAHLKSHERRKENSLEEPPSTKSPTKSRRKRRKSKPSIATRTEGYCTEDQWNSETEYELEIETSSEEARAAVKILESIFEN